MACTKPQDEKERVAKYFWLGCQRARWKINASEESVLVQREKKLKVKSFVLKCFEILNHYQNKSESWKAIEKYLKVNWRMFRVPRHWNRDLSIFLCGSSTSASGNILQLLHQVSVAFWSPRDFCICINITGWSGKVQQGALVLVDFRWNKSFQLWFLDKPQRRSHFLASHHSLPITQGFVDNPSKKGWLPAGHLCHFWHCVTSSPGLMVLAEGTAEQGAVTKGLRLPPSTDSSYQVIPALCLPVWFLLFSHASCGCRFACCFPYFFAGFGGFYITIFFKLFLCFWSLISGFPAHYVATLLLRLLHHWPFIHFGAGNLHSPYRLHRVHPWMK